MPGPNIFKKKDKEESQGPDASGITFLRTTTNLQEEISPPEFPGDPKIIKQSPGKRRSLNLFHRNRSDSNASATKTHQSMADRIQDRLSRSRGSSTSSSNLPADLPAEPEAAARGEDEQAAWETRATLLANKSSLSRSPSPNRPTSSHGVSDAPSDANLQEAIRLHEAGDLARATEMFSRLANPDGTNNALSQVLYGLALRHGWGCAQDEQKAVYYLSLAASNSAEIEKNALSVGIKKGGAAKGELSLAMFELANSFRNGWGVKKDPAAARNYYETAANMGDTDAMNEVAWCYLEGFGCKKDKFKAAQYLRLAEERGSPTVGNSWIWKDKYGGPKKT